MSKKISRRGFAKSAATGIVGLAVGAGIGYGVSNMTKPTTAPGETSTVTKTITEAPKALEKVPFNFWTVTWDFPFFEPILKNFETYYNQKSSIEGKPGIKLEGKPYTEPDVMGKMFPGISSEDPPDVLSIYPPYQSSWAEYLEPLDDYFDDELYPDRLLFVDRWDGKVYGLWYRIAVESLIYNTMLFEKAGIDKPPETWDELREAAEAITKPAEGVYGFGTYWVDPNHPFEHFSGWLAANEGGIIAEDGKTVLVDDPKSIEALDFWVQMYKDKLITPSSISDAPAQTHELFGGNKIGMYTSNQAVYSYMLKAKMSNYAIALKPWPSEALIGKTKIALPVGWGFSMTKKSKNHEAGWEFLKYMFRPVNHVFYERSLPSLKEVENHYRFTAATEKPFVEQAKYSLAPPLFAPGQIEKIQDAFQREFFNACLDKKSTKQACEDAGKELRDILG